MATLQKGEQRAATPHWAFTTALPRRKNSQEDLRPLKSKGVATVARVGHVIEMTGHDWPVWKTRAFGRS